MPERNNVILTSKSIKTGIILITILFVMLISSNAASAAISQQSLRCSNGVTIGVSDITDTTCGSSYTSLRTGLLLDPTGTSGSTIQFSSFSGTRLYAFFVNNTPFSEDVNVTGISGSISMDEGGSTTGSAYGKLEVGYYNPNGPSDNFVNLFNSSEVTATTTTKSSLAVSFTGQNYGTVPAGNKLAVRVWVRTSTSKNPRFYTFTTSSNSDSSIDVDITSLSAQATYDLSGYVTNASNGAAISGATVSVNSTPTQTKSTDGTGYYNFSLSNGTYLITASMTGYSVNSTTRTVNGASVGNINILLAPLPPSTGEQIIVSTNRYVVLDDPSTLGTAQDTKNFLLPPFTWSATNDQWSGGQTTIKGYALVLYGNGTPITNSPVVFTVRNWDSASTTISTSINTDSNGIASYSVDLNAKNYYGNWYVDATATAIGKSGSTEFIYNWWGCTAGGCESHGSRSPGNPTPTKQNSPYTLGREGATNLDSHHVTTDNDCVGCHRGYAGVGGGNTFTGQASKTSDVHITNTCATCHGITISNHSTDAKIKSCSDCHSWANLTKEYTMSSGTTPLSNYSGNVAASGHNPGSTIPCIICHGPMHNITKPDETLRLANNNIVEDSHCLTCHTGYSKHNASVGCTVCHSQDIHAIKVFTQSAQYANKGSTYQGNCTNCHQNATFLNALKLAPKAGSYSGSAPQVQKPLNHSTDSSGTKWRIYWTTTEEACKYCHGDNKHVATRLGNASVPVGTDTIGGPIGSGTVCASCHNSTDSDYVATMAVLNPDPVAFKPGLNWNTSGTDHVSYGATDSACLSCHNNSLPSSADIGDFVHNVDVGRAGNPDCVSCHNSGGSQPKVDVANIKASIHLNLNTGGNAGSYNADNKICWGCHTNSTVSADGKVDASELPAGSHPDGYNIPKKCTQCHTGGGNFNALIVSEHNSAGTDIRTKPQADTNSSCVNCHMKSEMITTNSDPGGPKSSLANVSHYGSNKTGISPYNVGGASNCSLCHQGSSAFSTEMVDAAWNASISNHSTNYASTNPACANCHSTGRIHDGTLTKPAFSLPNSAYCLACHNSTGSATLKNKEQHNGTVDCTKCHLNTNKNIHPVQYLEQGGTTFATTKTNAVNCTNCHQVKLANFTNAPIIPDPLKHSNSLSNGTLWGTFWTSESGSCFYCHSDTRHNTTALGRINTLLLDPSNTRNGAITNTQWCADCHYSDAANTNYRGNQLSPIPPTITVDNTGVPGWVDHTGYLTGGYKDNVCESCHALNGASSKTSLNYSHSLNEGVAGGADCVSCHNTALGGGKQVNTNAMNDTNALHKNLNHLAPNGGLSDENKKCWACHGDGNNPGSGHPSNYKTPYRCADCHVPGTGQNMKYNPNTTLLNVSQHYQSGNTIKTQAAGTCYDCHNKSEMMLGLNLDPDGAGSIYGGANGGSGSSSHYGKKRTDYPAQNTNDYCYSCHNNGSTVFPFMDTANKTISNHSTNHASTNPNCADCHSTGRIHNSTLNKPAFSLPNSTYCLTCHGTGGSATIKNKEQHNGTVDCTKCHLSTNKNIHPVQYLEQGGTTFATTKTNAVNCTNCHQAQLPGFSNAPIIPDPLKHSAGLSNGTLWGTFWTSESGSCFYCHSDTRHNTTALGRINNLLLDPSNTRNGAITNTQWCADCHYSGPNANYRGNQLSPVPPTITVDNTGVPGWVDHTGYLTGGYKDNVCETCHSQVGTYSKTSLNYSHSLNVGAAGGANCVACHDVGGSAPKLINAASIQSGIHKNLNGATTDINKACFACHGDGTPPTSGHPANYKNPKACTDCHTDSNFTAPAILNHKPAGVSLQTAAYCSTCHNNSVNNFAYTVNASVSHYGTNTSLVKPTVNQTTVPIYGFFTGAEASAYNQPCNNCHNNYPLNLSYGNATTITSAHTSTGACNQCHVNGNADNLHNGSLSMPVTFQCKECHTVKADQYKAPNLTGTSHGSLTCGSSPACHTPGGQFDNRNMHNQILNYAGTGPATPTVYLNGVATTLTVAQGTPVTITSTINDASGLASRVRGAEYFIDQNPGSDPNLYGKGIQMNATDGIFNAASEPVTASISGLSEGTHTIYVRGMDIGKQWSLSGTATLIITAPKGFINGTVKNGSIAGEPIPGVTVAAGTVSAVTDGSGNYSLNLPTGTYTLNATKDPEFNAISILNVEVAAPGTTQQNIFMIKKATGTITGVVTN